MNHRSIKTSRRYVATSETAQLAIARSLYGSNFNLSKIDAHGGMKSDVKLSIPSKAIVNSLMNHSDPEVRYRCLLAYDMWKLNKTLEIDIFLKADLKFDDVKPFGE